ncbi:hypothetical protein LEP1GSC013_0394 [Leptospira interrogans serovar Valbuzzi str. Duyster]|nr:hypothetical protein LEP1GSC013_0394 [Leptospira interrogans serovar Valbuzzi str. Duyster]ENO73061.1 hypothetical protein LEP1GSC012_3148 [Leptospira interrogans serovar Valbuzzi str. Valbuzzi]
MEFFKNSIETQILVGLVMASMDHYVRLFEKLSISLPAGRSETQ